MGLEQLKRSIDLKARFDPIRIETHKTSFGTSSLKPAKKPLMERYRRQKINNYLEELKYLVLSALNKEVSLYNKMEKADILDMAVKYIKAVRPTTTPEVYTTDYRQQHEHCYLISPLGVQSGNINYNNLPRVTEKTGNDTLVMPTAKGATFHKQDYNNNNNNNYKTLQENRPAKAMQQSENHRQASTVATTIWRPW